MSKEFRHARMQAAGEKKILGKLCEIDKFMCKRVHAACHSERPYAADFYAALLDQKYDECRLGIMEIRKKNRQITFSSKSAAHLPHQP